MKSHTWIFHQAELPTWCLTCAHLCVSTLKLPPSPCLALIALSPCTDMLLSVIILPTCYFVVCMACFTPHAIGIHGWGLDVISNLAKVLMQCQFLLVVSQNCFFEKFGEGLHSISLKSCTNYPEALPKFIFCSFLSFPSRWCKFIFYRFFRLPSHWKEWVNS